MRRLMIFPVALLAACQPAAPDPRGVARDETLLTVAATGRADTRPDEARLQLGVQTIAATAGEASRGNREKMDRVAAVLARLGVKPDDLQTRNLSLQRIDYGADRGRFRADNIIELKLRDMARVGDAVAMATDAGANVLSGPDLRVSDREASSRSAYAAAYRSARARADTYAGAAGLKVARVLAIYDGGQGFTPSPRYGGRTSMEAMGVQTVAPPPPEQGAPFSAGINTTEVQVRVDFALAPA
ncbi:MAG TPA: SIMPL domain-containing protein [Sphingomonadaceae bacterium]|nr:SIMPL domain-containing protein [Sphingomonadaceae bacterium]